jgi:alkanesulfonate monooxygenase SsuD/methylene tetrahydromethanopterin reductase-like flavin-dependent oxidoreductase (luciferase family)
LPDYGRDLEFAANVDPSADGIEQAFAAARLADEGGLDLVGVQDHPYQRRFLDTVALIAFLLARTERVRVFPNVANLPLRGPAMLAKQAASLDVLSGGRFELGLGAGLFWDAIAAMGGPARSPGEAVDALEEAIPIIRAFWRGDDPVRVRGTHYSVDGVKPGPPAAHAIGIWVGAVQPRMLDLTGRLADGWSGSVPYVPPEQMPDAMRRIDEGAAAAGRKPAEIRRLYNFAGRITDGAAEGLLEGPVEHWVEQLARFALDFGVDTFAFTGFGEDLGQLERFAREVVPGAREAVARERAR